MTIIENAQKLVDAHKQIIALTLPVLEELKDTSIPLEHRWEAFTNLVENNIFIHEQSYGEGFIKELGDNLTLYDDFYMDRGQVMTFADMYEMITDEFASDDLKEARKQNLEKWQEAVLASGYSSFRYDW